MEDLPQTRLPRAGVGPSALSGVPLPGSHAGLPAELRGYPLTLRRFDLAGRPMELVGPANYESLLDDPRVIRRFEQDEFMPYWAEFWPASLILADEIAGWREWTPASGERPRTLELGCGLGLLALLASGKGHDVVASDYEDDALAFVAFNAQRLGVRTPELRFVDWRLTCPDLRLDFIVASEILYETRNLRPIAEFAAEHLKPGGQALIVDSLRQTADAFETVARHCGLSVEIEPRARRHPDGRESPLSGRIFRLTHEA